jgi:hypothetical protein
MFVPDPVASGRPVLIWAMLRAAAHDSSQQAEVQWRPPPGGAYRTVATVSVHNPNGVLAVDVKLPGPGMLRVAWQAPSGTVYYSRDVAIR